jgi:hypothetical protein
MDQRYRDKLRDRERINSQKRYSTNSQRGIKDWLTDKGNKLRKVHITDSKAEKKLT